MWDPLGIKALQDTREILKPEIGNVEAFTIRRGFWVFLIIPVEVFVECIDSSIDYSIDVYKLV